MWRLGLIAAQDSTKYAGLLSGEMGPQRAKAERNSNFTPVTFIVILIRKHERTDGTGDATTTQAGSFAPIDCAGAAN